jgi:hypothetical protein
LQQRTDDVGSASQAASEHVRAFGDTLEDQSNQLNARSDEASVRLQYVGGDLQNRSTELSLAVDKAAKLIGLTTNALRRHSEELTLSSAQAMNHVDIVSETLKERAAELDGVSERATSHLRAAGQGLRQQAQELSSLSNSAKSQVDDVADTLHLRGEQVSHVSDDAVMRLNQVGDHLSKRSDAAAEAANYNALKLEQIADFLRRHVQETHLSVTEVTGGMEEGHLKLRDRLMELKSNYQDAERNLASLNETLVAQSDTVNTVSENAISKVNGWERVVKQRISEFGAASEKVSKQSASTTKSMAQQTSRLQEATEDAKNVMLEIKAQTETLSVEDFLRDATFILEKLQSLAVDMNRLLETTVSEEDWQRFNRGEKGVFVRKLLGFREKAKLAAIRGRYQEDTQFRDYVSNYMNQFEGLLQNAKKRDHQGVLGTTFLASDIGKVYMLLSQALGR